MGRELKRVPMDFKWPNRMTWKGYINPYRALDCKACEGVGRNEATLKIYNDWYANDNERWVYSKNRERRYNDNAHQYRLTQVEVDVLLEQGRLRELQQDGHTPTVEEVNQHAITHCGFHDGVSRYLCCEALATERGVYGKCEYCHGEGVVWYSEEVKRLHDEFEPYEPPTGEGYQLWQTTSEGSPVSPVFASLSELCDWCEEGVSIFGSVKQSKEAWKRSLQSDLVAYVEGNTVFI